MDSLVLHRITRQQLDLAAVKPSHAYLFVGPKGLGKTSAAHLFASRLLGEQPSSGDKEKWIMYIEPVDGRKISVKQTSEIGRFSSLTKPADILKKVVIIDFAEKLSIEAANSLLLNLEEPKSDVVFILITDSPRALPDTIISRLQQISFRPPAHEDMASFANGLGLKLDPDNISEFSPASLSSADSTEYQAKIMSEADNFIAGDLTDRLALTAQMTDKQGVQRLVEAISRQHSNNANGSVSWLKQANSLILARLHLYNNGNPKFVLEKLALDFE